MDIADRDFDRLRRFVHDLCGLQVPDEKRYLITHRLAPLCKSLGCSSWEEFHDKLVNSRDQGLLDHVVAAMTTNETSFFRDRLPFESFREYILPELGRLAKDRKKKGGKAEPVRIWCAASSTGQEPYTMAMLIHDYARLNCSQGLRADDFAILATDISTKCLDQARRGEYSELEMSRGLPDYYRRYFRREDGRWLVDEAIKDMVDFQRVNLTECFNDIGEFQFISSRNVLIYFGDEARKAIMDQFYAMLPPGGYLLLGASEGLYRLARRFEAVQLGRSLFYRKPYSQD
jgi:chemotaxis protein methyltransferase CheR